MKYWQNQFFIQFYLIGGLEHFLVFHILRIIIPTDFHTFQRGGSTTNQIFLMDDWELMPTGKVSHSASPIPFRNHVRVIKNIINAGICKNQPPSVIAKPSICCIHTYIYNIDILLCIYI